MSMDASDWNESGSHSECCGASVINPADNEMGICSNCKEWCAIVNEDE